MSSDDSHQLIGQLHDQGGTLHLGEGICLRTSEEMKKAILRCDVSTDADLNEHRFWLSAPWEKPQGLDSIQEIYREVIQNLDIAQVVELGLLGRLEEVIVEEPNDHDWDEHLHMAMVSQDQEMIELLLPMASFNNPDELLMVSVDYTNAYVVRRILEGIPTDTDLSGVFAHAVQNGRGDCADAIRSYVAERDRSLMRSELNIAADTEQRKQRRM
ncbi:hypothetical protein [Pseudoxanthomonas mexicana]